MRRPSFGISLLLALLLGIPSAGATDREEFVVVVSPGTPVADVSLTELRRIFGFSRRYWKAGQPITVIYPESALESDSYLLNRLYEMDYAELRRLILARLYQGELDLAPKVVSSEKLALTFVASGQGLITVVPADIVSEAEVEVLSVDGKLPGYEGYPLRR